MDARKWLTGLLIGFLLAGCSSLQKEPSAETKAALAPTGKLRGAFLTVPIYATKDASGGYRGVAPDLGNELAKRLGVPYVAVPYSSVPAMEAGAKTGDWDVVTMGINAERAKLVDFSAPYMEVEQGLLVRAGISAISEADLDRPGVRVGVLEKAGADGYLTKTLKQAQIVRAGTAGELFELLVSGRIDAVAGTKTRLFEEAAKVPGSRVLDGRILVEPIGMAVPKGRSNLAMSYVDEFVAEAKKSGMVKKSIDSAGLLGVTVAPLK